MNERLGRSPGPRLQGAGDTARPIAAGFKRKELLGMPWRVALALQADGWYLRSDIVWSKPNPMPESVTDRPTLSHEHVFLLSRSSRYFYDAAAIVEPAKTLDRGMTRGVNGPHATRGNRERESRRRPAEDATRNARTVWTVPTVPSAETHFATFPQALVVPCVLAGCPVGGVVLDPFIGTGTTALVARRLGRRCVGIELSPAYGEQTAKRTQQLSLLAETLPA
jgi:DNA modification methylase